MAKQSYLLINKSHRTLLAASSVSHSCLESIKIKFHETNSMVTTENEKKKLRQYRVWFCASTCDLLASNRTWQAKRK